MVKPDDIEEWKIAIRAVLDEDRLHARQRQAACRGLELVHEIESELEKVQRILKPWIVKGGA